MFLDNMETFQTIWELSRQSGHFPDDLETFQTIGKLSRLSILSRQSGNFPDNTETFQTKQKLSRQNRNFPDNPEMFKTIWKLSWSSRNFPETPVIFQTSSGYNEKKYVPRKNFPDAQKLSGEQCSRAPYVFLSLAGLYVTQKSTAKFRLL